MHVGISGTFWPTVTTGSGQHLHGLLPALAEVDRSVSYTLYIPRFALQYAEVRDSPVATRIITTPFDRRSQDFAKLWYEQVALPRAARADSIDVLHIPYFAAPLVPRMPVVVTIHDMIPYILKEYRATPNVRRYMRLAAQAARRAEHVITVSASSARDVQRLLRIPPERMHIIYNALPKNFGPPAPQDIRMAAARLNLPARYLLYLGGFDRRKNVPELVQAFAAVKDKLPDLMLVIAGKLPAQNTVFTPDPRYLVQELVLEERVRFIGEIREEDKPAVYAASLALIFPSIYEGFGLPVLEALACGTPAIVCRGSSLEEVAGEGALYVPPADIPNLASAILRIINEPDLRARLVHAGKAQAGRFSWEASARQTLAVYRAAMQARGSVQ